MFREVIHESRSLIIRSLGVLTFAGLSARVGVIHPNHRRRRRFELRHLDPNKRFVEQRIKFLNMVREHGLSIFRNKAQVAAIGLSTRELKIAIEETDQHRYRSHRLGEGDTGSGGVEDDFFAQRPLALPPRGRLCGHGAAHGAQPEDQQEWQNSIFYSGN